MQDQKLLSVLHDIGLKDKEARVYYSALQLGPCTALQISKTSGVKRSTVYSVIEELKQLQLMKKVVHGVRELFEAERPEHLGVLLERRQKSFREALPQLSALYRIQGGESVVKYYEGIEQVKSVYLSLLSRVKIGNDYLVLSNMEDWYNHAPEFFDEFLEKRAKLDIEVRMILQPSSRAKFRKTRGRKANEQTRLLPKSSKLTTNLVIIPSCVLIHQLEGQPFAMLIDNPHIVRMHREMYELVWRGLGDGD